LFVYSLGDLEDDFWPHTSWFGALEDGVIRAVCHIFTAFDTPQIQAVNEPGNEAIFGLLSAIAPELPDEARIHFGPAAEGALAGECDLTNLNSGWKMALQDRSKLASVDVSHVERLGAGDIDALQRLYESVHQESEGSHLFHPSMLDVGPYFGTKVDGRIVSTAGVHVYSQRFGVATVANVAT
jgi:hypothetical protein